MANEKQIITAAARKYGVNPKVLWGLYGTETNYGKNKNTSSAGAVGPFQFLPSTAKGMGVDPYNFKSAAYGAAKYLSQYKSRGVGGMLSAYNAGPAGAYQPSYVNTTLQNAKSYGSSPGGGIPMPTQGKPAEGQETPSLPTFNKVAYQKASSDAMLGRLLRKTPGSEVLSQALGTREPEKSEFMEEGKAPEAHILDHGTHSTFVPPGHDVTNLKGVASLDGKHVASWIAPILKYAKAHGWHGTVSSGYRSFAEQKRIYDSGVRPAAVPGQSNHEGTEFPRGAVDVTDAEQLSQVLRNSPYASALQWAGSKDPVHFSHPHGGSY